MRHIRNPRRFVWEAGDLQGLGVASVSVVQELDRGSCPADKVEKQGRPSDGRPVK